MKVKQLIVAALVAIGLFGTSYADSPPLGLKRPARTAEEIRAMKTGDKYVTICLNTNTANVKTVKSSEETEELCREGGKLECAVCKTEITIKRVGVHGKQHTRREVKYVDPEGKECMVLVPLN